MTWLATLWWLCFWTALGLCVGSFLNAVIYRLPRNKSLRDPLWSACPHCKHRISWYDNIPVLSFIWLRGRCRHCTVPIATRYIIVEVSMALVVLMLLDAFFIGQVRAGLSDSPFGLSDRLASDWPIFLAHIILFACLLPMSIIDLEHYWVDVRFTNLATIVGFALHVIWTPRHSLAWPRPSDATSVTALCALVGLAIVWVWLTCRPQDDAYDSELSAEDAKTTTESTLPGKPPPSLASPSRSAGWIALVLLMVLFFALWIDETETFHLVHTGRALVPLAFFFVLIVVACTGPRPSDQEIVQAIYDERHGARRMVMTELALLMPAVALGLLGCWFMISNAEASNSLSDLLHTQVHLFGFRHWTPFAGLATAASGYIIAGALGWTVRIGFTLAFGKEAFGSGDIHLMAAAGAVLGWPVVVMAFFLTCGLAMLGWLASLPFKKTRALPLGPWLALSFLIVTVYYDSIVQWPIMKRLDITANLLFSENSQFPTVGGIR